MDNKRRQKNTILPKLLPNTHGKNLPQQRGIEVKVRRHFNLDRIGHRYESIDIEVEADTIEQAVKEIEEAWRYYNKQIVEGKVQ